MRAVGLKVLKNRLSEYVRLAATGETVLVTNRDRVVAELGPPPARAGARCSPMPASPTPSAAAGSRRRPCPARSLHRASPWRGCASFSRSSPIYRDSSVALAHLLAEDRVPPARLWDEQPRRYLAR